MTRPKTTLLILILAGITATSAGWAADDYVYLKDGETLIGTIVARGSESLTMELTDPSGATVEKTVALEEVRFHSSRRSAAPLSLSSETIRVNGGQRDGNYSYAKVREVLGGNLFMMEGGGFVQLLGLEMEFDIDPGSGGNTFAKQAKDMVEKLLQIEENKVRLEFDEKRYDENQKQVAYMYIGHEVDSKMLNVRLLELGYARYVHSASMTLKYHDQLAEAEERARREEAGLWRYEGLSEIEQVSHLRSVPFANQQNPWTNQLNPYSGMSFEDRIDWSKRPSMVQEANVTPEMVAPPAQRERKSPRGDGVTSRQPSVEPVNVQAMETTEPVAPAPSVAENSSRSESEPKENTGAGASEGASAQDETIKQLLRQNEQMMEMMKQKDEMMQQLMQQLLEAQKTPGPASEE